VSDDASRVRRAVEEYAGRRIDRGEFIRRVMALGLSASGAGSLLAACGGGGEEAATAPAGATTAGGATTAPAKTFRARSGGDATGFDPAFWGTYLDSSTDSLLYDGLLTFKPGTFEAVNMLAEEFTPSADGLQFAFKLREGIPFHGGYGEVSADDVKFSIDRIAGRTQPNLNSPYSGDWIALDDVKPTGKYSGTIVLKHPFSPLLRSTLPVGATTFSGSVLSKKAVEDKGKDYPTNPIGTGPYELADYTPQKGVHFKKFAEYKNPAPELGEVAPWDELEIRIVQENTSAEIALETGELDFTDIAATSLDAITEAGKFATASRGGLGYYWIGMNVEHPPLDNLNLRRAIQNSIDVPSAIEAAYDGKLPRAYAIIPKEMGLGYWPDAPHHDRDVEKARGYLDQALRETGLKEPIKLKFAYPAGDGQAKTVAEVAQANLNEIGLDIVLRPIESAVLGELGDVLKQLELFYWQYSTAPDPSWSTVWFTCDQVLKWNWMFWCNRRFSDLHDAATTETDPAKRNAMYIEMQKIWDEDASAVWVAYASQFYAYEKTIKPVFQPDSYPTFRWFGVT
jgi:peptide/nickel transport system substrate-binding protein